jgi:hypothetical protein
LLKARNGEFGCSFARRSGEHNFWSGLKREHMKFNTIHSKLSEEEWQRSVKKSEKQGKYLSGGDRCGDRCGVDARCTGDLCSGEACT